MGIRRRQGRCGKGTLALEVTVEVTVAVAGRFRDMMMVMRPLSYIYRSLTRVYLIRFVYSISFGCHSSSLVAICLDYLPDNHKLLLGYPTCEIPRKGT
jgi:hypothetical protein